MPLSSAIPVFGSAIGIGLIILIAMVGCQVLFNPLGPDSGEQELTTEKQTLSDASAGEDSPSRHPSKSKRAPADSMPARIRSKLNEIIIPAIDFEDTPVEEAIDFLRQRARELDPDPNPLQRGVGMVIRHPRIEGDHVARTDQELDAEGGLGELNPQPLLLNYRAHNVPFWDALEEVARQADMKLSIDEFAITLTPSPVREIP